MMHIYALLAAVLVVGGGAAPPLCAEDAPCEFYQFCSGGVCRPCTLGAFGSERQCAAYNASLPWATAAGSVFFSAELHARAQRCFDYAVDPGVDAVERVRQMHAVQVCNASADGRVEDRAVVLSADSRPWVFEPGAGEYTRSACAQGSYESADRSGCVRCPGATTTTAAGATSRYECNACQLGWRWDAERGECLQCPRCYTTRPDGSGADAASRVTRAEACTPCSVFADDYRHGGCSPLAAAQCVLYVPMADVHDTMQARVAAANAPGYNGFLADKYLSLKAFAQLESFVDYVFNASEVATHALFRAQNYHRLVLQGAPKRAQDVWQHAVTPPRAYTGYAYTVGMMFTGSVSDVWQIDKQVSDRVVSMFELSGAHVVPMHNVSQETAPHYDMVRAAHEAVLRGVIGSTVANASAANNILEYALAAGLLLGADTADTYGAAQFASKTEQQTKKCDGDPPRNAPCYAIENTCLLADNSCTSEGEYYAVWGNTGLYLSNATRIFDAIGRAFAAWEQNVHIAPASALACDEERVRLLVNISSRYDDAPLLVQAIEVLDASGDMLLAQDLGHTVAALQTLEYSENVTVHVGSAVDVYVFTNDTNATRVSVQTRFGPRAATARTMPHSRAGFEVCEREEAPCCPALARVAAPRDFRDLAHTLDRHLCR